MMAKLNISDVIELIPDAKLRVSSVCSEEAEFDVEKSFSTLLASPLDFPTLDQAVLQEDTVCIPVEPGIPCGPQVVACVAKAIHELGVEQDRITILLPEGASPSHIEKYRSQLESSGCDGCNIIVHHSKEADGLGYLGPSLSGEPILLNARLVHADFVLPVARAQPFGWKSQIDFLYPYFSDRDSQKRFFQLNEKNRILLNEEVHRWLGNCFLVSIAAFQSIDPTNKTLKVLGNGLLGESGSVTQAIRNQFKNRDDQVDIHHHDLVIANLNAHLCLSLEEIEEWINELATLCTSGGTIVVLWDSDIEIPTLIDVEDNGSPPDWDRGDQTVFLVSDQKLLQQIGLPQITQLEEIKKLVERHESVLVLPDYINEYSYHREHTQKNLSVEGKR